MRHFNFDDSEVLVEYAKIVQKEGLLTKKAEKLYPDFDMTVKNPELELGLNALAAKHQELYAVTKETGDQLIGDAHKGGGTKLDLPGEKDLGKVETIVERAKVMEGIARGKATGKLANLIEVLTVLANALDQDGLTALCNEVDDGIQKLAAGVDLAGFKLPVAANGTPALNKEAVMPANYQQDMADTLNYVHNLPGHPQVSAPGIQTVDFSNEPMHVNVHKPMTVQEGHAKLQKMLGVPQTGKFDQTTQNALNALHIGSYNTWQELFSKVQQAKALAAGNQVMPGPGAGSQVARQNTEIPQAAQGPVSVMPTTLIQAP